MRTWAVDARVTLLYLFDVAEALALDRVPEALTGSSASPRIEPAAAPPHVQYQAAPLTFMASAVGAPLVDGLDARVRLYDYGVISLALTRRFSGDWSAFAALGPVLIDNPPLDQDAETCCRAIADRLSQALERPRQTFLSEDYAVFAVEPSPAASAEQIVADHGPDIARLLRGEHARLSAQEIDEVLRHRISYLADDMVVATWNAAFVCDTEAGIETAVEMFEFANSQLLQFRYYDQLLDFELGRVYDELQREGGRYLFRARSYTRAARNIHAQSINVRELLDRTENGLKFVGDIYLARLFALAATRLGLDRWKAQVREKLQTLDSIYHFAVEQTGIARGEFLELTIIAILVLELVLFFLGIMK
jgi:hypothetical protein